MKCHNWNHVARECIAHEDTCSTCGEKGHWTKDCTNKGKTHCVSCDSDQHASWSRFCPTFLKKCDELDRRTPENSLPFFPSMDPWTWASTPPAHHTLPPAVPPPILRRGHNQKERTQQQKNTAPIGRLNGRRSQDRLTQGSQPQPTDKLYTPLPSFLQPPSTQAPTDENIQLDITQDDFYV